MPSRHSANPTGVREEDLNIRLAKLLRGEGLKATSEHPILGSHSSRFDVLIELPDGLSIAVECKKGWSDTAKKQADSAAKGRLPFVSSGIAVCFPDGIMDVNDLDNDTEILAHPLTSDWVETTPKGLADLALRMSQELGDPDRAASYLKSELVLAVSHLSRQQKLDLAASLGLPPGKKPGWEEQAALRAFLVIAAAAMFHARLDGYLPNMRPRVDARTGGGAFLGNWPPDKLQNCLSGLDPITNLTDAWGLILAVDYKPVFETAITAVQAPSRDSHFTRAVRISAQAALTLAGGLAVFRHDLLGRIFHKILDTARYDGSFYTSTAAATLLAGLAVPPKPVGGRHWKFEDLSIVDPACGTGTLLMAAAERLQDVHPGGRSTMLGKALIEDILHGYDINLSATHMAATTLGLLSPEIKFDQMNIHECLFGVKNSKANIGSLEFYDGQAPLEAWPTSRQVDQEEAVDLHYPGEAHDLVIMNPPFTRDSLRYDQMTEADEKMMKAREKEIFGDTPADLSGSTGMFILLGEKLADNEAGCVAMVLPASAAGAPSANPVWAHVLKDFWVEVVVASHDPERIYFSENTSISEILIILRRCQDEPGREAVDAKFIRLAKNPANPTETIQIYEAYHQNKLSGRADMSVYEWPQAKIKQGSWLPVKFFSNYLVSTMEGWFDDGLIKTIPLGVAADVSPDGRSIRGAFKKSVIPDSQARQALWKNDTDVTDSMLATPDTYIVPKPGKKTQSDNLWDERGHLLIPARLSTTSMLLGAVWSDAAILGSGWVPVKPKEQENIENWQKAICVWLNSTPGILAKLFCSTPKKLVYPAMSIEGQRKIPVPDLTASQIDKLAKTFDQNAAIKQERFRVPNSFTRKTLDDDIAEILAIPKDKIGRARQELAKEPAITGKRYIV